ncbi:DNA methyltransferase [Pseudomonas trivialis]|uniref:DNA methyltransferase n=1 Tax=Pseudomonas trivialis TaxID=200450 RepID=UPI0030CF0668
MITEKIKRQLEVVDWDFSEHLPGITKSIHWYPGTYPSDLPATLIQALSKVDDLVIDPYGGVGTTGLEAVRQARKAWMLEANPIGCLAAYVAGGMVLLKTIDPRLVALVFNQIRQKLKQLAGDLDTQPLLDGTASLTFDIDNIMNGLISPSPEKFIEVYTNDSCTDLLTDWFEEDTLRRVLILNNLDNWNLGSDFVGLIIKAMTSSILRACSSQNKSWGHIADNVKPKQRVQKDVFGTAGRWLTRFETMLRNTEVDTLSEKQSNDIRLTVSLHNWGDATPPTDIPNQTGVLLVTSPPYAGAIDYTLAQRLSLYMFGFADSTVASMCQKEIGARRKRFLSTSHVDWANQISAALNTQLSYIEHSGHAVFVLPHKDAGRDIGTQAMTDCLIKNRWEKVIEVDRSIRQVRARQSWTSIKRETIHIFGNYS